MAFEMTLACRGLRKKKTSRVCVCDLVVSAYATGKDTIYGENGNDSISGGKGKVSCTATKCAIDTRA